MASEQPTLDHERLDVYRAALEFLPLSLSLIPRQGERYLLDQLERAAQSIILNIAEGGGRHSAADKRRHYEMAKGSATECAAILDILRARGLGTEDRHAQARALIVRVTQMLSRMCGAPGRGREKLTDGPRARGHGTRDADHGDG
jgi:four helix bundle protein